MTSKAEKILEQMKRSKANWRQADLQSLYEGFGFIITHGTNHDKIKQPDFPELRTTLPRHREIAKVYVEIAIKLINELNQLRSKEIKNG